MESYALVSKTLGHASHSAHCKHLSASTNPVMFTHQTPEPRYLLDPQGVSPHLRGQTIPRQQPLQTQDPAPHTPSPNSSAQPLRQQPRSRGGGTETVNRNAEATARLLRVSMPPLFAAPELRYRLRLSPLRPHGHWLLLALPPVYKPCSPGPQDGYPGDLQVAG